MANHKMEIENAILKRELEEYKRMNEILIQERDLLRSEKTEITLRLQNLSESLRGIRNSIRTLIRVRQGGNENVTPNIGADAN